jgi:Tol biopolymer transport system component
MQAPRLTRFLLAGIVLAPLHVDALEVELVNRTDIASPIDSNGPTENIADITPDGRYTLFPSYASNLLPGDTNLVADLFLHDATSGTLERVNLGNGAAQADAACGNRAGLSDDGRYVVFDSAAGNLVAAATYGYRQIYLRDRTAGTTTLLTQFGNGDGGNGESANPKISADGRFVAFETNVAFDANDTNGVRDVYRLDRQTGAFTLISVSETGGIGNAESIEPQISADGSSVAFKTRASNLVPNDTNGNWDLLLRKPATGATLRISRKANGSQLNDYAELARYGALSADGRYVLINTRAPVVDSDTNPYFDGYRYDSQTDSFSRVTLNSAGAPLNDDTEVTAMSRDASRITMLTGATNVIPGVPGGRARVFVRDIASGTIRHVTFRSGAEQSRDQVYEIAMSDDGNIVVARTLVFSFVTGDTNGMSDVIRQSAPTEPAQRLSAPMADAVAVAANRGSGEFDGYSASADGRFVAFASKAGNLIVGDTNGTSDVFVRDRLLDTIERVSVYSNGNQGYCGGTHPGISDDGRYVVFNSCTSLDPEHPSDRQQIYVHDRLLHTTRLVSLTPQGSPANNYSNSALLSGDGRYVAYESYATDLVAGDNNGRSDIFLSDLATGTTMLVTRSIDATGAIQGPAHARISRNGRYVAFTSDANNLVPADTNDVQDVFVFDRETQSIERVSVDSQETQANGDSNFHSISDDGSQILFFSSATNLANIGSPFEAMYVRDRNAGTTEFVGRTRWGAYFEAGGAAAISGNGRRIVFVTDEALGLPQGKKLVLFDRDTTRFDFLRPVDERFEIDREPTFTGNDSELLVSTTDNTFIADDANNHFSDVFVLSKLEDTLFADGFQTPQ